MHAFNTLRAVKRPGGERSGAVRAEKQLVKGREGPAVAGLPPRRQSFRARYRYLCPPPIRVDSWEYPRIPPQEEWRWARWPRKRPFC